MEKVNPAIREELQRLQTVNGNDRCVDCDANGPQWASPKFGIYICLSCAGVHRSLGVHISFVRSVTMDNFKTTEYARMKAGGNTAWKEFFNSHDDITVEGRTFDECTIKERYDSRPGVEWKERLTASIENREFDPSLVASQPVVPASTAEVGSQNASPHNTPLVALRGSGSGSTPRPSSPAIGTSTLRSGPGSRGPPLQTNLPGVNDFQKDPVNALSMGLEWLGATVSKGAKDGLDGWVKPGVEKIASSDITTVAQRAAAQLNQGLQTGTRSAADVFSRFIDGPEAARGAGQPGQQQTWSDSIANLNKTGQTFWNSLAPTLTGPITALSSAAGPDDQTRSARQAAPVDPPSPDTEVFFDSQDDSLGGSYVIPGSTLAPVPEPKAKQVKTKPKQTGDFWDEFGLGDEATKPVKRKAKPVLAGP